MMFEASTSADQAKREARTTSDATVSEMARPYRGRRLSWAEFYRERPDLRPADNENQPKTEAA